MALELHSHQTDALRKMHNGCVLKGGVGSGKSVASIAYYIKDCGGMFNANNGALKFREMERPRDLYIVTTKKKRDSGEWFKDAGYFGVGPTPDSNVYGRSVTIVTWNKITELADVKGAFFIFDEQRLVGYGAWVKAFLQIAKNNRWILLSATPGDTWMDYMPVFLANGFYKNKTEFMRRHVVFSNFTQFPKIDHYVEEGLLEKLRHRVLVDMPFTRHTARHLQTVMVEYDKEKYKQITQDRWHIYEDRPLKDVSEMFAVMRKLVNSDPSRLGAVMKIIEEYPKLILFYNFNYELEALRTLGATLNLEVREWNGHKHEELPTGNRWLYLVQYTAGAEGWNCITTNVEAFYSLNYSYKINEQSKGRIDRINTPYKDLYYYLLRSSAPIDLAILKAINTKQNFSEKKYSKKVWDSYVPF